MQSNRPRDGAMKPARHGRRIGRVAAAVAGLLAMPAAQAQGWCDSGVWADAMIGSHHIHPQEQFKQFNPGLGLECWPADQWGLTAGGFRNSLGRPSWYGGGLWAPGFAHWGYVRLAVMGGIISGYNYGRLGLGSHHTVGPVVAPIVMTQFGRIGANFIVIPPIPADRLPFTVGFQLRVRFN